MYTDLTTLGDIGDDVISTTSRSDTELFQFPMVSFESKLNILCHCLIIAVVGVFGLVGNSLVIYIYTRKTEGSRLINRYYVTLAVLDITSLCITLPQTPLVQYYTGAYSILRLLYCIILNEVVILYLWVMTSMALQRVIIVYFILPSTWQRRLKRFRKVIPYLAAGNMILLVVRIILKSLQIASLYLLVTHNVVTVCLSLALFASYTAVIVRIRRSQKQLVLCTQEQASPPPVRYAAA